MADAYRVLNVSPSASLSTIRSAYLELACQHHPCKLSDQQVITSNANHTQFRLAAEAYALVGDESRRELYDLIKSPEFYRRNAGRYVHEDDGSLGKVRHGTAATGRSRARSELTIDLRAGLPPELRAFLVDLDPVKVFNRVVCQIDQERRAEAEAKKRLEESRLGSSPASSSQRNTNTTNPFIVPQSKYLSPPSRFLDEEGSFSRTGNTKISTSGTTREDNGSSKKPQPLSGALKTGILRDESKSQFRQSPSSLSELLSGGDHSEPYQSSINSEYNRESIRSSGGYSTSSSSCNISYSASPSRGRNNRSRRVSFSNDVIESDQIKLAREAVKAVKSFKPETGRSGSKPILINSSTSSRQSASSSVDVNSSNLRGLVNKFGLSNTQGSNIGASSSHKNPNDFFLDKSLYSDFCSPIDSIPQDILVKSIGIPDSNRDSRGLLSFIAQPRSSHSQQLMGQKMDGHYRDREGQAGRHDFLAASAPTGFLSRYRTHQDLIPDKNLSHYHPHHHHHHHHHRTLPSAPLLVDQVHHPFPWSDPNFDNPRSIPFNHESRDAN
ncbi:hypothetical protein PCANC_02917 [Puccinia coronata f. sp. avenae]|uniref:J domain-containing protein n=1 Tax=Puccinia coronata f. sp. avenae TaxID=200324 RepID=A0A2N5T8D4_9BASI|nr:hypothetical protein PCANC_02917 [Puccinia coronata f. sp. avenae]